MDQAIEQKHDVDGDGNPAGGHTVGVGIDIVWQDGPLGRGDDQKEPNGAFVEGVIKSAIGRMQFYQEANEGKFRCRENAIAITKLEEAVLWMKSRTSDREKREVEGTHKA